MDRLLWSLVFLVGVAGGFAVLGFILGWLDVVHAWKSKRLAAGLATVGSALLLMSQLRLADAAGDAWLDALTWFGALWFTAFLSALKGLRLGHGPGDPTHFWESSLLPMHDLESLEPELSVAAEVAGD